MYRSQLKHGGVVLLFMKNLKQENEICSAQGGV